MFEKCLNAYIEKALWGSQFEVKWGKNRRNTYWILTPNEGVLSFQVPDVWAKFCQNPIKIATVRVRTDTHTHTPSHTQRQRWQGWSYDLSRAIARRQINARLQTNKFISQTTFADIILCVLLQMKMIYIWLVWKHPVLTMMPRCWQIELLEAQWDLDHIVLQLVALFH